MSDGSTIEWTDATWNPVRGCTKVSTGCKFCYAETFAERWRGIPGHPYEQGFDLRLVPSKLEEPLTWAQPKKVFVNSMSDLFHEKVPRDYIARVFHVMEIANWHVFQVLTKRALRQQEIVSEFPEELRNLSNVCLGVSVENRKVGIPRIEYLQNTPAAVRFLSVEPLLEDIGMIPLKGIDWVIVGGESGSRARPIRREWVRNIRDQCIDAGVKFFFKQWGGKRKKLAGRELDGRTYDEFPRVDTGIFPTRDVRRQIRLKLAAENA